MFQKQRHLISGLLIVLLIAVAGCKSKFEKLKASNDNAKKYQAAIAYYNKKDYSRALELFETLVQRYRGQDGAQDLYYYYAYTNYRLKDYTSASYHFKQFADTYASSPRAEECAFMSAYCYYLDSPIYSLDQENTLKAIDKLQLFINLYPKSDRVSEASKLIQNLRDKLERKAYENAKLYLTIGDYQSAVIDFGNVLRDYPDTKYAEEMEYLTIKAQYLYAEHSNVFKQEDRYNQAIGFANQFTEKYPSSKYLADAASLKKDSQQGLVETKKTLAEIASDARYARRFERDTSTTGGQPPSLKINTEQKTPPSQ
ncbi:MAG: outer membrane protein assembly factor BamD [Bacteroidetes bacterium]|nr:outer membrane protein assembly factor BamD [Bacteroidota bacterium]